MDQILISIRNLLMDHLVNPQPLTVDAPTGSVSVTVPNTSRYKANEEIYFFSSITGKGETAIIDSIPDYQTLNLKTATVSPWLVASTAYVQKAINFQPLQGIYIGDLKQIPKFPAISITPTSESNEWMTLRGSSHEYRFAIRSYILADNFETSELYLTKLTRIIREILMDHIRPIIAGQSHPLTVDLPAGSAVVDIADTSDFAADLAAPGHSSIGYLRDASPTPAQQESYIKTVLSPTQIELVNPSVFDYLIARQAEIIRVERMLYDTRPESISVGYVRGAGSSMLRASEITWFAKEFICREGNFLT